MRSRRTAGSCAWLVITALAFTACSLDEWKEHFTSKDGTPSDIQDRQQGLTRQDYRDMNKVEKLLPKDENGVSATASLGAPPIPDLAQVLAAPRPPKVANSKLVTLSVTDDVPLRDVLFELGRLASVDIEVGSGLEKQGINLRATDRPFNEVIERIADLGQLRYSVSGNAIRVERDTPYIKNYTLDFINIVRSSTSSYSLTTSILSGSSSSSGSSESSDSSSSSGGVGTSGSSSTITSQAESDLWTSLESSLTEILSYKAEVGMAAQTTVATPAAAAASGSAGGEGGEGAAAAEAAPAPSAEAVASGATSEKESSFVVNRQAGVLSVNATQRQHEMVDRFLTMLTRNVSAQVIIEAKIVEVSLRDQFLSGINWSEVIGDLDDAGVSIGNWQPAGNTSFQLGTGTGGNGSITLGLGLGDLETLVEMTERFGTTRTLSSPRLSAINNQQAVLTFAENRVFFNCSLPTGSTSSTIEGSTTVTGASVECTTNSVPIGIILSILPSVNLDSQEVTLSVRPTLTRQVSEVENPGIRIAAAAYNLNLTGSVPVIEVREIDSVMKVRSGGVMVIGGLMEDTSSTQNRGVPGVSEMPLVGNLFKSRDEDSSKRELIILIKATIVNTDGNAHPVDRAVFDRFTTDPRPAFPPKK